MTRNQALWVRKQPTFSHMEGSDVVFTKCGKRFSSFDEYAEWVRREFSITVNTGQDTYIVVCKDAGERNSVTTECDRDGYQHHIATDADQALQRVEYLDWNPA
ncbi:hypothetical protein ACKUFS_11540 [Pseudomonas cannabina]|uniref:Uncharacterized protein n=1 Tax=Pseudomonas syringae pv. maculicola str. ES4326 TaxID=629265 RepID=A0A8T8C0B8_PSEYM|nr:MULTISPECIES: hypothetical protein [Pseudomonas syringae group]QHE96826.1 hypothetical protein PMA4326_009465 [Pseudomonas syringae pv. maculicola str. ES4326]QQN20121.1 hypothetical protein JGS08_15910 [Pseudomonas cannabina pv. alisalensis]UBY97486.1 hypothetical protein LCG56_26745 [Pseudomonas cannabina pv. alisalensis]